MEWSRTEGIVLRFLVTYESKNREPRREAGWANGKWLVSTIKEESW